MQTKAWEMKSRDRKKSSKASKLKQFLKCEICCLVGGRGKVGESKL